MTYGPPQPPDEPTPPTAPGTPTPKFGYTKRIPLPGALPPGPDRRPPSPGLGGAGLPGGPTPVDPTKGRWLAVVAVILGVAGCVLPLTPFNLDHVRAYIALPFALPGLVVGIIGCTGRRRGTALAVTGSILSVIALGMTAVMLIPSG